jgi:hypothetical protein
MKPKATIASIFILFSVLLYSCRGEIPITGAGTSAPTEAAVNIGNGLSSSEAIGTVSNIKTQVRAGVRDNLKLIEGETGLGNDDFVKVTDGGKARLEFPGPISLLLFNQSDMDSIKLEYDANSNPRIVNRLIRGGFSGYVGPGHHLTIDLAFGVQVNVLGTNFFIVYDEDSGFITIGKFDGTLIVSLPGQNNVHLDDSELVDVTSGGTIKHYSPISFTPSQFEEAADTCNSPIQGVNILRRDNELPLPGEATADKNTELPCGSSSLSTVPPETPACQTPTASVKVKNAYLRDGPDIRFVSLAQYKNGDQFTVLGRYQGWFQVEAPDGKKGWLYKDWLAIPSNMDTSTICLIPVEELPPTPQDNQQNNQQNQQNGDACVPTYYVSCP